MSTEQLTLLDAPETLSPRLAWMREHDVKTRELTEGTLWGAWYGDLPENSEQEKEAIFSSRLSLTIDEDSAIERLAQKNGWKLWNE